MVVNGRESILAIKCQTELSLPKLFFFLGNALIPEKATAEFITHVFLPEILFSLGTVLLNILSFYCSTQSLTRNDSEVIFRAWALRRLH